MDVIRNVALYDNLLECWCFQTTKFNLNYCQYRCMWHLNMYVRILWNFDVFKRIQIHVKTKTCLQATITI
jgi:hypothetical protein